MNYYHYIFTGAGAAGLSLLTRMIESGKFRDKQILVVDSSSKQTNDRTWCFWEKEAGYFDHLIYKRYNKLWFHSKDFSSLNDISPYTYKLLRGIDFYKYCLSVIRSQPNITWREDKVDGVHSQNNHSWINIGDEEIHAEYIFNSIVFEKPTLKDGQVYMLQHFMGWVIETDQDRFNEGEATLMDFRVDQIDGSCFVYVMPFSSQRALVEFTIFGPSVWNDEQYEIQLTQYVRQYLGLHHYDVLEKEKGVIPMTSYNYPLFEGGIVNIGTAGGQTKASSGYTFQFIQKQCVKIIDSLDKIGNPYYEENVLNRRFALYDHTLLNILNSNKLQGAQIFKDLFQRNKMTDVLKFLDNETNIGEELKIFSALPTKQFIRAALDELF